MDASTDEFRLAVSAEKDVLLEKLKTLVADDYTFDNGARVLAGAGSVPPMTAILQEIDDTMLERKLTFQVGDAQIAVIAAGRRLQGFVALPDGTPEAEVLINQVLSNEEPSVLQAATTFMLRHCETEAKVTVRSEPAKRLGKGADAGMTAAALSRLWDVDLAAEPTPPVERFLSKCVGYLDASLYAVDDVAVEMSDNAVVLQAIWERQVPDFLEKLRKTDPHQPGPVLVCLENAVDGNETVAVVNAGREVALFSYQPEKIGTILQVWNSVIG